MTGGVSVYLLAPLAAWLVAQGGKYVLAMVKSRKLSHYRQLYISGGMPSAHSATTAALLAVVGLTDGVDGALFGMAALFTAIVMYDAMMVRHASGTQGVAIHALIAERKSKVALPRVARGHTPLEVAVGAVLGVVVGVVVFFATK